MSSHHLLALVALICATTAMPQTDPAQQAQTLSGVDLGSLQFQQDPSQTQQQPAPNANENGNTYANANPAATMQMPFEDCNRDATKEFALSLYEFSTRVFKICNEYYKNHFVLSQYSVWLSLAAMAEGAADSEKEQFFNSLNLPQQSCIREKYYDIAQRIALSGPDVKIASHRVLAVDEGLRVNQSWSNAVRRNGLLDIGLATIKVDPEHALKEMSIFIGGQLSGDVDFSGNSVLLDEFEYEGLWPTAFPEASIEHDAPFYDDAGNRIGNVDYIKIKKKAKVANLPTLNAKVIDVPIGVGDRYRFLMMINKDNKPIQNTVQLMTSSIITEIFSKMKESIVPLEITFPKFTFSMQHEKLRPILEKAGVESLWKAPLASLLTAAPPSLPSALVQRISVTLGLKRLGALSEESAPSSTFASIGQLVTDLGTGIASALGRNFIANRPFLFALVDAETHSCLYYGAYSQPISNSN